MSVSFAAAHTALVERMTCAETAIAHNHAILMQIQSHLGLSPISPTVPAQASSDHPLEEPEATTHLAPITTSLDMLAVAVATDSPPASLVASQSAHAEDGSPTVDHH